MTGVVGWLAGFCSHFKRLLKPLLDSRMLDYILILVGLVLQLHAKAVEEGITHILTHSIVSAMYMTIAFYVLIDTKKPTPTMV